ncbi:MAG TPA: MmgE/PrpD family protein [Aurantimonas coralicida]|uniref:MmgE/PrpD family protein n=2 Tax=root TaxID=1 RepID=A0A9C9TGX3_9HYPH|nr:MmgE/PrpD family protein [Aurantimonas coralicida]HEU00692.1 MmgE/PrpD family protein [Aurantimonas coralicida]
MKTHQVRALRQGERLPVEAQLAWKIAEMAAGAAPLDGDAAEMAANRIIDDWAVALAALNQPSVIAARGAVLAHPRKGGATVVGLPADRRFDCSWAGYANAAAIRELDFNDSFFAADSSHPGDVIGPIVAVAQQAGVDGRALLRGIVTAYEIQVDLVKGIELNRYRIDHVAHLGPAVAGGIGAMLGLPAETIYQAVNLAAQLSISTRQTRKGQISSYKAAAPGHVGQVAILAIDRAMRCETSPAPVYEGDYGLLAILLGGPDTAVEVPLPEPDEPRRGILETYPKEHSAGYHGQALIDLAFRMRDRIGDIEAIEDIVIRTKRLTHVVMGSGAGDPEKWDPTASRETLDHSAMYIFAVALQDGVWDHERSYAPERAARPDTVRLWRKVRTVEDPEWSARFTDPAPLDKAHGARVVVTYCDGRTYEEEIAVANAHPRGARPFGREDYRHKFGSFAEGRVAAAEAERFLAAIEALDGCGPDGLAGLGIEALPGRLKAGAPGLFDHRLC